MELTLAILALISGLFFLVKSADWFVSGASSTAKFLGLSQFLIGMFIVGFGTSVPEMLVSATAALNGTPALALGNAYGSNICNIALILGITALISPINVDPAILKNEIPKLIFFTIISLVLVSDGDISRIDAIILLVLFALFVARTVQLEKRAKAKRAEEKEEAPQENTEAPKLWKCLLLTLAGLIVLIISSKLLVFGGVTIAKLLGVNDLIVGLTIVAVGTSLPELASSIAAARKGNNDLAIGNIVGSNIFNTLAVVGIARVIKDCPTGNELIVRDMGLMLIVPLILFVFCLKITKKGGNIINRYEGSTFLIIYIAYTALLIYQVFNTNFHIELPIINS